MRWSTQQNALTGGAADPDTGAEGHQPLLPLQGLLRSVRRPEFAGITFHEVAAKSVLNQVPQLSRMPFRWTINPYRGCSHACVYCFARASHTYLDFNPGLDFDSQVVVKVNAVEVLQAELARPRWRREHVALGTNTDPYQRAEGRYRLMPGIIAALADSGTPLSILTKGSLLSRDIPDLAAAARSIPVGIGISLALTDDTLAKVLEPGTPTPRARLTLISRLREAGLPCGVMAMPILPWLTDTEEALDALFGALRTAGATGVTAGALYLRPGTKNWFMSWLARYHPRLVGRYRRLYESSAYAPAEYRKWLAQRVAQAKTRHDLAGAEASMHRTDPQIGEHCGTPEFLADPRQDEARYPKGSLPIPAEMAEAAGSIRGSSPATHARPARTAPLF